MISWLRMLIVKCNYVDCFIMTLLFGKTFNALKNSLDIENSSVIIESFPSRNWYFNYST